MEKRVGRVPDKVPTPYCGYLLANHDKLTRVIEGSIGPEGRLIGGLGKDAAPEKILAEYDKLGGAIFTKDGQKVKMGSFYDFENRTARAVPLVEKAEKPNSGGVKVNVDKTDDGEKPRKGRKTKVEEE